LAWLYAIARNTLFDSARRRRVADRARHRLRLGAIAITDADLERVDELASSDEAQRLHEALSQLPPATQYALEARIVDEATYAEIAKRLQCSEAVVRQRVRRGLTTLGARLEDLR
jgi:RNA polymerase sigma-70 factor (ECF subfamily)